jgi:hypothetical protein
MRDWVGSRVRADALLVPCAYCLAVAGVPCHAKDDPTHPLEAFPAHDVRVRAGQKAAAK